MRTILSLPFLALAFGAQAQSASELSTVRVMAVVSQVPPRITLQWQAVSGATGFTIYRRAANENGWTSPLATLPGSAQTYADATVQVGTAYEYKVVRNAAQSGYGYIRSGISVPEVDQRGKLVLLVESVLAAGLAPELDQLQTDLEGDGWIVLRHDVSAGASPVSVRAVIIADHAADPGRVKAVYIVGHVPVPYSGDVNPDGHIEHLGAWPCDGYYGDMDGAWTDTQVNNTSASYTRNHNVPGDGKFDQSDMPSPVELQVGRVDLSRMDAFPLSEVQLTRQYLAKAHAWKTGEMTVPARASVWDNLTWVGTPLAFSGFAGAAPCVGVDSVLDLNVQQQMFFWQHYQATDELFTFQCSTGLLGAGVSGTTFTGTSNGLSTADLIANEHGGVFNMSVGSYFGDWDNPDNFLRASLASGNSLVHAWSGMPIWYVHPLAMGEPIGYCALRTMNNTPTDFAPQNGGWQASPMSRTHLGLMGDPSLRLRYIAPPSDLVATNDQWFASFNWSASPEPVDGYHIYRIDEATESIVRITSAAVQGTSYTSSAPFDPGARYMVRAIKLMTTPSGSYHDLSLGAMAIAQGQQVPDCLGVLGGAAIPGTACDDGNASTVGEVYDATCTCLSSSIGIPEQGRGSLRAWPSPADGSLYVAAPFVTGELVLRSSTGGIMRRQRMEGDRARVDVGAFPSGVYLLEYTADSRTLPMKLRFVVQR
ncbi:MAG: hypothetical protein IPL52_04425 [Flavobacteriales bacterium]|nr:hypothetical protein [Flavobacteriales bacterium]